MLEALKHYSKVKSATSGSRSAWDRPIEGVYTLNAGEIIPLACEEILPGDTFIDIQDRFVLRNMTPAAPVMDNAYIDYYWFYIPNRIIAPLNGDDWAEILGENKETAWTQEEEINVTARNIHRNNSKGLTILDYLGLPNQGTNDGKGSASSYRNINPYPLIGYWLIWNEWFRDQNTQAPITQADILERIDGYTYTTSTSSDGNPIPSNGIMIANKFHDLFTSCLPAPQKGPSVTIPMGTSAPLAVGSELKDVGGNILLTTAAGTTDGLIGINDSEVLYHGQLGDGTTRFNPDAPIRQTNLVADLSEATAATINQLRQAFAIQRFFEQAARTGSRYREIIKGHFNVEIGDVRAMIPEMLGGHRTPINVTQVLQTSATTEATPLGYTGAFSNTSSAKINVFNKSFSEHGFLYCLAVIRNMESYSQGAAKMYSRLNKFDYFWPEYANLGEQPIFKWEIKANLIQDLSNENNAILGYQEPWAHYRYSQRKVVGYFNANFENEESSSLQSWTYTNEFTSQPTLNADFMKVNKNKIGKTLINQNTDMQFLLNFYSQQRVVRKMPLYSIPGLLDHVL